MSTMVQAICWAGREEARCQVRWARTMRRDGGGEPSEPIHWVNFNDLTTTSLEIMVSKGNHPQMALIQIGELL